MVKAKPDCTGQRFGMLTVLGKGNRALYKKSSGKTSYHYLWKLLCDCGKIVEIPRAYFDRKTGRPRQSCGCYKISGYDNNRRPKNIAGQKFGSLTAIKLTGEKDNSCKPTWLMQCDCGNTREISLSNIKAILNNGWRLNCGKPTSHPDRYFHYPLAPIPFPKEASDLVIKYLHLTNLHYVQIDSEVEDEKRDRLLRAAWIITYRRWQGESIPELYESRIIKKHLRYCSIDVFWQRKLEKQGGLLYDVSNKKREIGNSMTNVTLNNYPVLETQGIKTLSAKKLRFKRL